jgi:hypothetical protein
MFCILLMRWTFRYIGCGRVIKYAHCQTGTWPGARYVETLSMDLGLHGAGWSVVGATGRELGWRMAEAVKAAATDPSSQVRAKFAIFDLRASGEVFERYASGCKR